MTWKLNRLRRQPQLPHLAAKSYIYDKSDHYILDVNGLTDTKRSEVSMKKELTERQKKVVKDIVKWVDAQYKKYKTPKPGSEHFRDYQAGRL